MFFRDITTVAGPILVVLFFMATQSHCDSYADDAWTEYLEVEEKMNSNSSFRQTMEIIDVSNSTDFVITKRNKRSLPQACPTFQEMLTATQVAKRSLSPWKFVGTFDSRRPEGRKYIPESVCCTEHCYDHTTGKQVADVVSLPMTMVRAVKILENGKYVPKTITVKFGCYCKFVNVNSPGR